MVELLTRRIAKEYVGRAKQIPDESRQDVENRRELRMELQERCGLTELEAVNIINGYHIGDYVAKYERRYEDNERSKEQRRN